MLEGIVRESIGKKGTKALRRDGYLIANIYGKVLKIFMQHSSQMSISVLFATKKLYHSQLALVVKR